MIVIDNSAALKFFLEDERDALTDGIHLKLKRGEWSVGVPSLFFYEFANSLKSAVKRGRIDAGQEIMIFQFVQSLMLSVFPAPVETTLWFSLAHSYDLSLYDAAYLALAKEQRAMLYTFDRRLMNAAFQEGLLYAA